MRTAIIINLGFLLMLCHSAEAGTTGVSSKGFSSKALQPNENTSNDTSSESSNTSDGRLARITAYWPGEDRFTTRKQSATGARLRDGFCAVDSRIIPYGSVVKIPGVGDYLAMDTGTAVISRKAAKESGHNSQERSALVIDLYFPSRKAGELFSREGPKFAMVAWESGYLASRN
jgi:3D (Asp-Asp-Asp) domain-containing protein